MSFTSWSDVKESTLKKSWKNITPKNDTTGPTENQDDSDDEDDLPLSHILNMLLTETVTEKDVNDWMNDDKQCELCDEAIANVVSQNKNSDDEDDDTSTEGGLESRISHTEGLSAIEKALLYIEQQDDTSPADIIMLRRLRSMASKKRGSAMKQKTVKDFFQNV